MSVSSRSTAPDVQAASSEPAAARATLPHTNTHDAACSHHDGRRGRAREAVEYGEGRTVGDDGLDRVDVAPDHDGDDDGGDTNPDEEVSAWRWAAAPPTLANGSSSAPRGDQDDDDDDDDGDGSTRADGTGIKPGPTDPRCAPCGDGEPKAGEGGDDNDDTDADDDVDPRAPVVGKAASANDVVVVPPAPVPG
jgi:hypothetical protein